MSNWLAKARNLYGITAKTLADNIGVSLNYIQQIENGRRPMSETVRQKVYGYFGFRPTDISFDSEPLVRKLLELEKSEGGKAFCLCKVFKVNGISYVTDVARAPKGRDLTDTPYPWEPIRICYAKSNIEAQMKLFEGHTAHRHGA